MNDQRDPATTTITAPWAGVGLRRLTATAALLALSAVGAAIRVPGVLGTPALDSAPAYVAGFVLGPGLGALTGAVGHLFTAFLHGFPLTLPVHLVIAGQMALIVASSSWLRRRFGWTAGVGWAIVANGVLAPASFIPWPGFGAAFFLSSLPQLLVASAVNAGIAAAVSRSLLRSDALAPFLLPGRRA